MDKQQATEFILNQLELGFEKTEIVEELSRQLKAPTAMVIKFVDQVASTFEPPPPAPEHEPRSIREDIPSWIADLEAQGPPSDFISRDASELQFDKSHQYQERPSYEGVLPGPPVPISPAEENLISPPKKDFDPEELTAFVLQELKRQRRLNDVVETVCQRTGWHWNEAQRFVARARTSHHGEISKSQNRFMIPFSIIFILGGVLLLTWSVAALVDYYQGFTSPEYTNTLAVDFLPLVIGALAASFGIIAGGIYGLYRTLAPR